MQVTGLPRVSQPVALRPTQAPALGPLYDPNLCIGGLVDCWTSVKRTIGHLEVGPQISLLMDRYFDDNPQVEQTLQEAIGADDVVPSAMLSVVDNLRLEIAEFL